MIRKTLTAAAIALGLIATPALASLTQFYHVNSGQWSIEGFTGDKNFCSAKTYWDNDNSYMSLFNMRNSDTFSLMVHNANWNIIDPPGYYDMEILFTGSAGSDRLVGQYELRDSQTLIIRDLTDAFIKDWIVYRHMTLKMPGNIQGFSIGLTGTRDSIAAFSDCIDHLNN